MATWSGMRHKLESEYLAVNLRGRIRYFVTTYRESHDQVGRAAILFDGKEILKGNYFNYYLKNHLIPDDLNRKWHAMDDVALEHGIFDEYSFYKAFSEFDNQSIEESLTSDDYLVRIFAILDRRVGKRRLVAMKEQMRMEPIDFQIFYGIRMEAEGIDKLANIVNVQ